MLHDFDAKLYAETGNFVVEYLFHISDNEIEYVICNIY